MARYKVCFSRNWLLGRWGFTDRVLAGLGGKPVEPSLMQPAWVVNFDGSPVALGRYLTHALKVRLAHDPKDGAIFEIQVLESEETRRAPRSRRLAATRAGASARIRARHR